MSEAVSREPERGLPLVRTVFARAGSLEDGDDLRNQCVSLILNASGRRGDPFAAEIVGEVLGNVAEHTAQASHLALAAAKYIIRGPVEPTDLMQDRVHRSAIGALERIARAVLGALREMEARHTGIAFASWPEEDQKRTAGLVPVGYDVSQRVYFESGADDEQRPDGGPRKPRASPEVKKRFLEEGGELLDIIAELAHPEVIHHLLRTLEAFVPVDLRAVFLRIAKSVKLGRAGGYEYDSLAADLVVGLVRRYLAEHRHLFRDDTDCRAALIELLDTFIQAGWPAAQRLTYNLDEIFR